MLNKNNDNFGNLLDLFSIILGYENLMENRQQTASNDVEKHKQKQTRIILNDFHEQFNLQNSMLKYQNSLLEKILKILKENKNEL